MANYDGLSTAIVSGNADQIAYYEEQITKSFGSTTNSMDLSLVNRVQLLGQYRDSALRIFGKTYDELTEEERAFLDSFMTGTLDALIEGTKTVEDMTPETEAAWRKLAETDEKAFIETMDKLPQDVNRQDFINELYKSGGKISSSLQEGLNSRNVSVKIGVTEPDVVSIASSVATKMKNALGAVGLKLKTEANGGAFYGGSWHNIAQYANGGLPSHGSMFVAGERGAELVGHVGGRTEVLNQSQIASTIYQAVASAMSQYSGGSIEIHAHTDEGVIIDRINQRTRQTGTFPLNIPV